MHGDGVTPQAVSLLPALPPSWHSGTVTGLCLPGNATTDLAWENGKLQTVTLHAAAPWQMQLHYAGENRKVKLLTGQSITLNAALQPV